MTTTRRVYTTSQAAGICCVSPRMICKWFDAGRLRGFRLPGSKDRRIPHEHLIEFLTENGMESLIPQAADEGE